MQWVHRDINRLKSNFSEQYLIFMCQAIAKNNKFKYIIKKIETNNNFNHSDCLFSYYYIDNNNKKYFLTSIINCNDIEEYELTSLINQEKLIITTNQLNLFKKENI